MLNLLKYEIRKTMFSKMILLVVTAVAEIVFLGGVFLNWDNGFGAGTAGLILCASVGICYIGIESLLVFHRDLNTKQSYMLFLTPKNSYQILGAKVLENGISISITGIFYAVLAAVDGTIAILHIGGLRRLLEVLDDLAASFNVSLDIPWHTVAMVFAALLVSWLMMIVMGDFAIVLSATVLAGKRFSGLASFGIYMLLAWASSVIINRCIPDIDNLDLQAWLVIGASLVIALLMYLASCWIMERKLSV